MNEWLIFLTWSRVRSLADNETMANSKNVRMNEWMNLYLVHGGVVCGPAGGAQSSTRDHAEGNNGDLNKRDLFPEREDYQGQYSLNNSDLNWSREIKIR